MTRYSKHVDFTMGDLVYETEVRVPDLFLGVLMVVCCSLGIVGNCTALRFFFLRRKAHITTSIFIAIAFVDVCTEILGLPIATILLNARNPGLFNNLLFCVFWANVFEFFYRVSIFLAMTLSVTRAVLIVLPFHKIREKVMLSVALLFSTIILTEPVAGLLEQVNFVYIYNGDNPNCYQKAEKGLPYYFQYFLEATNIFLFSTVTFLSFVVILVKLWSRKSTKLLSRTVSATHAKFFEASVTVSIFTGLFLLTNLPLFINLLLVTLSDIYSEKTEVQAIFSQFYIKYYSWVISKVVCIVLNASLNPLVYILRMKDFRSWINLRVNIPNLRASTS